MQRAASVPTAQVTSRAAISPPAPSNVPPSIDTEIRKTLETGGFSKDLDPFDALVWAIKFDSPVVVRALLEGVWVAIPAPKKVSSEPAEIHKVKKSNVAGIGSNTCRALNPLILAAERGHADVVG